MTQADHPDSSNTHNAGFPPAAPQGSPKRRLVQTYRSDPRECVYMADLSAAFEEEREFTSTVEAMRFARKALRRGCWVEVFDPDTNELLSGTMAPIGE
jgi:hypothetical protein